MGRIRRCCSKKDGLRKGGWTDVEDQILTQFISRHGVGGWTDLPRRAGLKRCGKSCRLRWFNYLRPDLIRGNITQDEESLIVRLHKLLGNRWSLIAGRLPGRSDNEIKNYWNTKLKKKVQNGVYRDIVNVHSRHCPSEKSKDSKYEQSNEKGHYVDKTAERRSSYSTGQVIRPKAIKCTKVYTDPLYMSKTSIQQQLPPHPSPSPQISPSRFPSCSSTMACDDLVGVSQATETKDSYGFDFNVEDFDLAHLYDVLYYCG